MATVPKRAKRATRACDHCRWKRLKCSDEPGGSTCMNCILYGQKCEYTGNPPAKPAGNSRTGPPDNTSSSSTESSPAEEIIRQDAANPMPSSIPSVQATDFRHHLNPDPTVGLPEDSPKPAPDDIGAIVLSSALEEGYSIEKHKPPEHHRDPLAKQLSGFITPMLTGREDAGEPLPKDLEKQGLKLASTATVDALVTAFFQNIIPLYPILDEASFRLSLQRYRLKQDVGDLWPILLRLVLATGAASCQDTLGPGYEQSLEPFRKALFAQVLKATPILYSRAEIRSIQIMLLISLYCLQIRRNNSAWYWCGSAIRLAQAFGIYGRNVRTLDEREQREKDLVGWTAFLMETRLTVLQGRVGMAVKASRLKRPSEEVKRAFPIFFMRFQLALLTHRFCVFTDEGMFNPARIADGFDRLFRDMMAWRDSLPEEYKPERHVPTDIPNYHFVLLIHMDYYAAILAMSVVLGATARLVPKHTNINNHPSAHIRNHHAVCLAYSRYMLQTVITVSNSLDRRPNIMCWMSVISILAPLSWLYAYVMDNPAHPLARSDLKLMHAATQLAHRFVVDSPRNKSLEELLVSMIRAATMQVVYNVPSLPAESSMPSSALSVARTPSVTGLSPSSSAAFSPASVPTFSPYMTQLSNFGSPPFVNQNFATLASSMPNTSPPTTPFYDFSGAAAGTLLSLVSGAGTPTPANHLVTSGAEQEQEQQQQQQQTSQQQQQHHLAISEEQHRAYMEQPLFTDDIDPALLMLGGFFGMNEHDQFL